MNIISRIIREEYLCILGEMASPSFNITNKIYYHGTNTKYKAKSIMKHGISFDKESSIYTGRDAPVNGKVYITPNLDIALNYATRMGGDSKYGYLFVIDGSELVNVEPDEDDIGILIIDNEIDWLTDLAEEIVPLYDLERAKEVGGDLIPMIGKLVLPELTDDEKIEIITKYNTSIAHEGTLKPFQCWEIKKETVNASNKFYTPSDLKKIGRIIR